MESTSTTPGLDSHPTNTPTLVASPAPLPPSIPGDFPSRTGSSPDIDSVFVLRTRAEQRSQKLSGAGSRDGCLAALGGFAA